MQQPQLKKSEEALIENIQGSSTYCIVQQHPLQNQQQQTFEEKQIILSPLYQRSNSSSTTQKFNHIFENKHINLNEELSILLRTQIQFFDQQQFNVSLGQKQKIIYNFAFELFKSTFKQKQSPFLTAFKFLIDIFIKHLQPIQKELDRLRQEQIILKQTTAKNISLIDKVTTLMSKSNEREEKQIQYNQTKEKLQKAYMQICSINNILQQSQLVNSKISSIYEQSVHSTITQELKNFIQSNIFSRNQSQLQFYNFESQVESITNSIRSHISSINQRRNNENSQMQIINFYQQTKASIDLGFNDSRYENSLYVEQ